MKKLLLSAVCFLGLAATTHAQLPNGSIAPDFTVTDLNGVTHTLSEYIAQGKTVIIDISATWCNPCWNYHESGALEKLYYTYGPEGSDEVVVLFIEGDSYTSVESLYGTNMPGDSGTTQGNWTLHSPYPVIDSAAVAQLYQITYFPTIFRVCPDGKVSVIPQLNFEGLRDNITANCQALTTLENHAKAVINDYVVCEGSALNPQVLVKNFGTQTINNATIELRQGATVLATKNYAGPLTMFDDTTVTFDSVEITPGTDYEAIITSINGAVPGNEQTATDIFDVTETLEGSNDITVKVHTNFYPAAISWAVKNSSGAIVTSGGPYMGGNEDFFGGGGPNANTTKTYPVTLANTQTECYSVEFYSSNNIGWMVGDTPHGIEVVSGGDVIFSKFVENFGSQLVVDSAFKTNGVLSTGAVEKGIITVYPNPTTGMISFHTAGAISISIVDTAGKTVYTADNIQSDNSIDLSALQKGIYIAKIESGSSFSNQKIIIK